MSSASRPLPGKQTLVEASDPRGVASTAGGSSPSGLPAAIRPGLESSFGMDLADVRVHADSPEAAGLGAEAFARGRDLHFAPGRFDPTGNPALIAHEVAHVAQQAEGRVAPTLQGKGLALNEDSSLEAEADRMADAAVAGRPARTGPTLAPVAHDTAQGYFNYDRRRIGPDHETIQRVRAYLRAHQPRLLATFTQWAGDTRDHGKLTDWVQRNLGMALSRVPHVSDESSSEEEPESVEVEESKPEAPEPNAEESEESEESVDNRAPPKKRARSRPRVREAKRAKHRHAEEPSSEGEGEDEAAAANAAQSSDESTQEIGEAPRTPDAQLDSTLDDLMSGQPVELMIDAQRTPWQWRNSGRISEHTLSGLIPGIKGHIKSLVRSELGAPKQGVNDVDDPHSSEMNDLLKLQPSATCLACETRGDGKLLISGNSMPKTQKGGFYQKLASFARGEEVTGTVATGRTANAPKQQVTAQRTEDDDDMAVESYRMVQPNTENEHAELNLLDYENRHNDSHEQSGPLAVSFPCCMLCAACLLVFGQKDRIEHLGYHEDRVVNWGIPDSLYSPTAFRKFVGDAAADVVGDNVNAMQRLLQLLRSQHDGWSNVAATRGFTLRPVPYVYQQRASDEGEERDEI